MFLKNAQNNDLVEITNLNQLFDPCQDTVKGRYHAGEEMQDEDDFAKSGMIFPSGEKLPTCWIDPGYKN